jgi:hypothetical protein
MAAEYSSGRRRTSLTFTVPQLSDDGLSVLRYCQAKLEIIVPDGAPQTDVDDIVGYIESASKVATTNLNDLLVDGEGVW